MNKVPLSRSTRANTLICESSNPPNYADKLRAGVAIVAVSLLAACQSPLAISPIVADTGSVRTVTSSSVSAGANEALPSDGVRMASYAGPRSDAENIMDEDFEIVATVDNSGAFETYVLQRGYTDNLMDQDYEFAVQVARSLNRSAASDSELVSTPDGWFVAPEDSHQFAVQADAAERAEDKDSWVSDGHLIRWTPEAVAPVSESALQSTFTRNVLVE